MVMRQGKHSMNRPESRSTAARGDPRLGSPGRPPLIPTEDVVDAALTLVRTTLDLAASLSCWSASDLISCPNAATR
jgi:hypothetical protein